MFLKQKKPQKKQNGKKKQIILYVNYCMFLPVRSFKKSRHKKKTTRVMNSLFAMNW